jgi:hypothetical protein
MIDDYFKGEPPKPPKKRWRSMHWMVLARRVWGVLRYFCNTLLAKVADEDLAAALQLVTSDSGEAGVETLTKLLRETLRYLAEWFEQSGDA